MENTFIHQNTHTQLDRHISLRRFLDSFHSYSITYFAIINPHLTSKLAKIFYIAINHTEASLQHEVEPLITVFIT